MKVDNQLIERLAHLARLNFSDEEKEEIKQDLQQILGLVDKLEELELDDIEPLVYINDEVNVLREDEIGEPFDAQSILTQAPQVNSNFFRVPKVIER